MTLISHRVKSTLCACLLLIAAAPASAGFNETLDTATKTREAGFPYTAIDQLNELVKNHSCEKCTPLTEQQQLRVNLELARAYFDAHKYQQSINLLNDVLASDQLPPVVRNNVENYREKVKDTEQNQKNNRIAGSLRLLVGRDTNAAIGPDEDLFDFNDTLDIPGHEEPGEDDGDEDGNETEGVAPVGDNYVAGSFALSHQATFGDSINLGGRAAKSGWRTGLYLFDRNYEKVNSSDFSVVSFSTGPTLQQDDAWMATLDFRGTYFTQDSESLATFYSIIPTFQWFTGSLDWQARFAYSARQYYQAVDKDKEGYRYLFGLDLGYPITPELTLIFGGEFLRFDAKASYRSYTGGKLRGRATYDIDPHWRVFGETSYLHYSYDSEQPGYDRNRQRDRFYVRFGGQYNIDESMDIGIQWSNIDNNENIAPLSYDKSRFELFFNYRFEGLY